MTSRRSAVTAAIVFVSIFTICRISGLIPIASSGSRYSVSLEDAKPQEISFTKIESPNVYTTVKDSTISPLSPQVLKYFDQVFSVDKPADYDFPALRQQCEHTKWPENDVYLQCVGMAAGLTSIMSQ